jgi:hypothetical protein
MGNIATIHSVLKKKNYKAKFLMSSILKKKSTEIILEKKNKHQKKEKKSCWKHCSNSQCFCDESYSASLHDLALFVMTCNYNLQTTQY